jgi:hypothetical protein
MAELLPGADQLGRALNVGEARAHGVEELVGVAAGRGEGISERGGGRLAPGNQDRDEEEFGAIHRGKFRQPAGKGK